MTLLPFISLPTGVGNLVIYKTLLDMQSHVTLMIYLKGIPILETDKKLLDTQGSSVTYARTLYSFSWPM